ncbi:MAG: hypothetical protein HFI03_02875 [Lachnospiraceae bacterium]|jgi:hypothetical protein|nr:hypothetical protein [Lachnospiraceae bacterium]
MMKKYKDLSHFPTLKSRAGNAASRNMPLWMRICQMAAVKMIVIVLSIRGQKWQNSYRMYVKGLHGYKTEIKP